VVSGRAILVITMIDGSEKEYDLTIQEVNAFLNWYDTKAEGTGKAYYVFNNNITGPYTANKDYIIFDKIMEFKIMEYD